jgi:hopene-associated glycosyltransferase HpnB
VTYLLLLLACSSLLVWIVLTFFRGAFWQLRSFDVDISNEQHSPVWPLVVAVVPARNEAGSIACCVESLLAQAYPGEFQIIVVDDQSEDGTGALALSVAQSHGGAGRVTVLPAADLPAGWTGKLWALQQGVERAKQISLEYFWFTDADIEHAPDTLRRLVARAEREQLDLVSLMVLLQARTFPERLLIPPFLYFFLMLYPPKWTADVKSKTAGAAGGCLLLRKKALERIGGIAAIRGEVIDDCALAGVVKHSGGKIWMGLTRRSVSLRAYATWVEICNLIARTAFTQLGYSVLLLLGTIAGMLLTYVAPPILTFHPQPMIWRVSLIVWALMILTFLPTVRFYRLSPLWAPLLPFAAISYSYATCLSAVRYWLGHGGQWKGRVQAPPGAVKSPHNCN